MRRLDQQSKRIRHQYFSAAKARRLLGWSPLYTLERGLAETVVWYKDFLAVR